MRHQSQQNQSLRIPAGTAYPTAMHATAARRRRTLTTGLNEPGCLRTTAPVQATYMRPMR